MNNIDDADVDPVMTRTAAYPMVDIKLCPVKEFETTHDVGTGGRRKRKYALVFSMSAFPNFSKLPEPIMTPVSMDTILIDADSVEDLRARAYLEVDGMIAQLNKAIEDIKAGKYATKTPKDTGTEPSTLRAVR